MQDEMPDEPRDAHLRAALRHAPDGDAHVPPALSAAILHEARAKVRSGAAASARPARRKFGWAAGTWLSRPGIATGLVGVMTATVVGLMWWDEPLERAEAPRPVTTQSAPPAQAAAPEVAKPVPSPKPANASPGPTAAKVEPEKRAGSRAQDDRAARKKEMARDDTRERARETASPTKASRDAAMTDSPLPPSADEAIERGAATEAAVPRAASPSPSSARTPSPAPPPTAAPTAEPLALAPRAEQRAPSRVAELAKARGIPDAVGNAASFNAQAGASWPVQLSALRMEIAAAPTRWQWQRGTQSARPVDEALLRWLDQASAVTAAHWVPAMAMSAVTADELRLLRDGQQMHALLIGDDAMQWQRGTVMLQALLPAPDARELRNALDAATR